MKTLLGSLIGALIMTTAAHGALITYVTTLSGASESPPTTSAGTGFATVGYNNTAHTLQVDVVFSGLTGLTTASHIHCCTTDPGAGNAGVATTVPTFTDFPLNVTAGTYSHLFDLTLASSWNPAFITSTGSISAAEASLASGLASDKTYLNIHTTTSPGGEIRGFLLPTPEPATGLLTAAAGLGLLLLRRKARS
jgi:hypothetical protein